MKALQLCHMISSKNLHPRKLATPKNLIMLLSTNIEYKETLKDYTHMKDE